MRILTAIFAFLDIKELLIVPLTTATGTPLRTATGPRGQWQWAVAVSRGQWPLVSGSVPWSVEVVQW